MMDAIQWVMSNWNEVVLALIALLSGVIAIALIIPGEQPEKALQKIVDFLTKISKK